MARGKQQRREWTTTEFRRVLELRAKGVMTQDIAREIGRTENAIYSALRDVPKRQKQRPVPRPAKAVSPPDRERETARIASEKYTAALLGLVG